jgi:peptide/nickel transport system substrate-binding protein
MVQIYLNITHKDPKQRELFANKEFRQALSMGIDRKEIIDIVFLGQSEPWQFGPRPEHPWYNQRASKQFTEHEPAKANALLDKIGLNKKDSQGFRLRPDGQKVFMAIDVIPANPYQIDTLELVKRHWMAIGIDMKVNVIERALYYTRGDNNDHDAAVWGGPGGLDPMLDPRDFFAQHPQGTRYAIPWTIWYSSNGKDGQEPPEHQKKRMKLFAEASGTTDLKKRGELMKEVFDIAADNFETIGICLAVSSSGVARNNLKNVPAKVPNSWSFGSPGTAGTQQMYFTS